MHSFRSVEGIVLPIDQANVDTDALIPKQYLKSISRRGYGGNLFDDWRYLDPGESYMDQSGRRQNPDCPLNWDCYKDAKILLARENFGCGSSREHAVWALHDYGIQVIIAQSFADIFYANTLNNGLLAISLEGGIIDQLFRSVKAKPGCWLQVNLLDKTIIDMQGEVVPFEIAEYRRQRLLKGTDDIDMTLGYADDIRAYEVRRYADAPWLGTEKSEGVNRNES